MSKRIISFLLAVTMVMSLFGFSFSVSAAEATANYPGSGGAITFNVPGFGAEVTNATVEVSRLPGNDYVIAHNFSVNNGVLSGSIQAGVLTEANYVLRIWPGAPLIVPVQKPPTEPTTATVTFSAGTNGTLTAAVVGGASITSSPAQVNIGADVVFTATPNTGFRVASWTVTGGGAVTGTPIPTEITRPVTASGLTVAVTFEEETVNPTGVTVTRRSGTGSVRPSATVQFDALVTPAGANQNVIWTATNNFGAILDSSISNNGLLTVPANATNGSTITVRATAVGFNNVFGTATITINDSAGTWDDGGDGRRQGGGIIDPGLVVPTPTPRPDGPDGPDGQQPEPNWGLSDMKPAFLLFNDVPMNAWFHDFVTVVHHFGLMHGVGYRTFDPQGSMTRAMFIQVLANLEEANLGAFGAGTAAFNDIAPGDWFYPAVQWAQSVGITTGVGEGRFAPNASVTREEMARLLNNYATFRNISLPRNATTPFTDAGAISSWAVDDVAAIQAAGIIGGYPDGSFGPRRTATRAEVATIFAMYLQATGKYTP
ncbi:MAG: S-layer homology domain-containing protein [Defluviitaleaceae bacterium]|nr:S-layer homology domain-containing protein [Defluviitaleaceae bacterium]